MVPKQGPWTFSVGAQRGLPISLHCTMFIINWQISSYFMKIFNNFQIKNTKQHPKTNHFLHINIL